MAVAKQLEETLGEYNSIEVILALFILSNNSEPSISTGVVANFTWVPRVASIAVNQIKMKKI